MSLRFSRQGRQRQENRDAGGLLALDRTRFAMIVDGGSRGPKGAELARTWVQELLGALATGVALTPEYVIAVMAECHAALRRRFPADIAAYTAVLLREDLAEAWALSCGDCRLGVQRDNGSADWLTPVHTLATALPLSPGQEAQPAADESVLTRCWNARRFTQPELQSLDPRQAPNWLLATDGYWGKSPSLNEYPDDASYWRSTADVGLARVDSDCANWFEFHGTTAV